MLLWSEELLLHSSRAVLIVSLYYSHYASFTVLVGSFSYTPHADHRSASHTLHAVLARTFSYSCTPLHARVSYDIHASQSFIL